jgi:hypothetical protein
MARSSPQALAQATNYQNVFNGINKTYWAGSNNVFPVRLGDGRKLWITGLSWAGNLTSTGTRSASAPMVMNAVLLESTAGVQPFAPAFRDTAGRAHFLDSSKMWNIGRPVATRLEPLAGIALNNCLYLTVVSSASDYTSYMPTGSVSIIEIPQTTLNTGGCSISQSGTLPVTNGVTFGVGLFNFDRKYLYLLGRQLSGSTNNLYWARVDTAWISGLASIANRLEYLVQLNNNPQWSSDPSNLMPVLSGVGPNAYAYSPAVSTYNYLYTVGMNIYGVAQRTIARPASAIRGSSVSQIGTIPANTSATNYTAQTVGMVPWVDGVGYYCTSQTALAYDIANPNFARPHFFSFQPPTVGRI